MLLKYRFPVSGAEHPAVSQLRDVLIPTLPALLHPLRVNRGRALSERGA